MPEAGELYKGHYFKGGSPKDKVNWVKAPEVGTVKKGFTYQGGAPWEKSSWTTGETLAEAPGEDFQPFDWDLPAKARGLISGLAGSATLGYAPKLYGKTQELLGEDYEQSVKEYEQYAGEVEREAPIAAGVGKVGGYLAPGKLATMGAKGLIRGAGALRSIGRGAIEGGLIAGGQEQEGDVQDRAFNAAKGMLLGGAIVGGAETLGTMGKAFMEGSKALRIKGAGAMLRDFRNLHGKGKTDELAAFLQENKIVKGFIPTSVKSVAKKAEEIRVATGKQLSKVYDKVRAKFNDDDFISGLSKKHQDEWLEAGFFPGSQRKEVLNYVTKKMGDEVGAEGAVRGISRHLDGIIKKYGDDIDLLKANEIKSAVDRAINYSRNPLNPDPIKEQALKHFRTFINNKIKRQMKFVDEVIGTKTGNELRALNKRYGHASTTIDMAVDKIARESGNRVWGLSEQIATGAGGVGGLARGADPLTTAALAGGGFIGSLLGRKYGAAAGAGLLRRGAQTATGTGTVLRAAVPTAAGLLTERARSIQENQIMRNGTEE